MEDDALEPIMLLYHEFDDDYLMLKGLKREEFMILQEFIMKERDKVYKELMSKIDERNMYCIGKLWLQFFMIEDFPYQEANVSVRINLEPFALKTKGSTQLNERFSYDLTQQFLLYSTETHRPVHNYFSILKLEIVKNDYKGVLSDTSKETLLASFKIPLPDIIQEPYASGKVRLPFRLQSLKKSGLVCAKTGLFENK